MRVTTRRLDAPPPLVDHDPPLAWISDEHVLIGFGEALRFSAGFGDERFDRAERTFREWSDDCLIDDEIAAPGTGPTAFTSFTFDSRSPGSVLIVPEITLGRTGGEWFATTVGDADPAPYLTAVDRAEGVSDRPRFAGASIPDVSWVEAVAEVIDRIRAGEAQKVVMARDFALWSRTRFDTRRLLTRLMTRFPHCFTFAVDGLIGASPELLVRTDGHRVSSVALAGTAARSADPATDERLGAELLGSPKDLFEHRLAAMSVERVLEPLTDVLSRDETPSLRRLDNVQHLATSFDGSLSAPLSALTLAGMLHPTAAVGGDPTDVAVAMIRELEGMDRGRYAGPVGWMDSTGNGEFAIALRCAEISGARARLFTGAGIMADSLPENELEETRLKLGAMMSALE
ncbi:MAG TPA: isochorismate synthase [Acidimicrobiia bacterium]|jgi:menaquinone-specific isochorismate synthase